MKRSLLRVRNLCLLTFLVAFGARAHGLSDSEWKYRQPFPLERAGIVRLPIPLETLDHAQSDLRDLRIVGADGNKVPYALVRSSGEPPRWRTALHTTVSLRDDATVITVDADERKRWEAIGIVTPASSFLKAARAETSDDGKTWELRAEGAPLFRQDGAEKTTFELPPKTEARFFRITINDRQQKAIVVTGVNLREPAADFTTLEPVAIRVAHSDDYATETVLTLALPAANIDLESLQVSTPEGIFTRQIRAVLRDFQDSELRERILSTDTIFRLRLDGAETAEKTRAYLPVAVPSRELTLYLENGDSPPLRIEKIEGVRRVVYVAFEAMAPGRYSLWSGNPEAAAPRYDLAAMSHPLRRLAPSAVAFEPVTENPNYHRPDLLAGLTLEGAALAVSEWHTRRAVHLENGGVHLLELDLSALSSAQPSLADLRLVRAEKQVPYILERTRLSRAIDLAPTDNPDPKAPNVSRWRISLPRAGAPITQLELSTPASLFQREVRVFERRDAGNGERYDVELGRASWQRTPQQKQTPLLVPLERPASAELWISTENGDNPGIALSRVRALYPVTRLLFRTQAREDLALLSGNPLAAAPRYDLGLVASTLLASDKTPATLAPDEQKIAPAANRTTAKTALFWGVLGLVVVALLVVVAKLLPKPPQ